MGTPEAERSFGKYRLLDRIATGGMAEIYRARYEAHPGVTKPVVIKKILPAYAGNANFVTMFVNEARIVVGLAHGNIAQVFDFGEIEGEYFLAMEFVHGQPLSKVLKKARSMGMPVLPVPHACFIGLELCKGLHYAHTRRDEKNQPLAIIHRDVSPQNVLLSYEGQVKIVDFGIAKARNATNAETQPGAVKGKYVYFAPEQARGKDLDQRTDVFAAGIVLYEMLCGRLPFEGRMMDVFNRILKGDFDRPRSVNANIPVALENIILKAMASEKAARYQTAQELSDALGSFLWSQAPNFSTGSVAHLMSYLYEVELMREGVPVRIPPDFLREIDAWRGPAPAPALPELDLLDPFDPGGDDHEPTSPDKPRSMARGLAGGPRDPREITREITKEPSGKTPRKRTDPTMSLGPRAAGSPASSEAATEMVRERVKLSVPAPMDGANGSRIPLGSPEPSTDPLAPRVFEPPTDPHASALLPPEPKTLQHAPRVAPEPVTFPRLAPEPVTVQAPRPNPASVRPPSPAPLPPPVPDDAAATVQAPRVTFPEVRREAPDDAAATELAPRVPAPADRIAPPEARVALTPFSPRQARDDREITEDLPHPGEGLLSPPPYPRVTPILPPRAPTPVATAAPHHPLPRWLFFAVPAVTMLLALIGVLAMGSPEAEVKLVSDPPGAVVLVDGTPAPTKTPVVITGLSPEEPHLLEVQAPGMQPWSERVTLTRGELRTLTAKLTAIAPPPAPVPATSSATSAATSIDTPP